MSDVLTIEACGPVPGAAWNRYVEAHPAAGFFHRAEWHAVYARLPWITPCPLAARRGERLVGVLPLAEVRWGPGGSALVSAPYCVEAGAIGDDEDVVRALEAAALGEARSRRVAFLELRQGGAPNPAWPVHEGFATFARTLAGDAAANLAAVPRKQRAMIRKGEQNGLRPCRDLSLGDFYALYAASVRNLGTPVYDRRLFEALLEVFGERVAILALADDAGPLSAVLSFFDGDRVLPYYAGGLPRARALKAYDYLYWCVMCDAVERGCTVFDFGRSVVGSGAYAFKKNWGFAPRALAYQVVPAANRAAAPLDPDSPFNRFARRAWSHLPLAVANRLGPLLARRLY
ncbi:MAG: FemAB family XrtA/PEP-CTERM system-associated protein [Gammaproteobacteria bacterium]